MRPVDFHTTVARLPDADKMVRQGERPAVQQTFAAEVQRAQTEREQTVQRNEETEAVRFDPRQRDEQQQQGQRRKKEEEGSDKGKRRRHLDIRI